MKIFLILRTGSLVALVACILVAALPVQLGAQEDVLQSSDPGLRVLRAMHNAFLTSDSVDSPVSRVFSPDSLVLDSLDRAKSNGADYLRAATDLLAVYDNMQCIPDRAAVKALLEDRLHLYSRLLDLDAEGIATVLGLPKGIKLPGTGKKALKLRDDLLAAKNKLDAIADSLK